MPHLPSKIGVSLLLWLAVAGGSLAAAPNARRYTLWPAPPPAQPAATPELLSLGERVYRGACIHCHGAKGDGLGPEGKNLAIPPRDFTTGTFLIRSTPSGSLPTDADLFGSIRRGFRPDVGMPAFTFLSDTEVWAVVAHLKTFSGRWKSETPRPPVELPPPPGDAAALAPLGKVVFISSGACFVCHGMAGLGDGPAGAGTVYTVGAHVGKRVPPANLSKPATFKGGARAEDIYRSISTGLDGTPMPGFPQLSPEQRWQLTFYVLSLSPR